MNKVHGVSIFVTSAILSGCSSNPIGPAWQPVDEGALSIIQSEQLTKATDARDAMFGGLMAQLTEVMEADGPVEAIAVCKDKAPEIARAIAEEHGVAIGRTSYRLRNPENAPPNWAEPLIEEQVAEPRYLAKKDGTFAAFLPIRLRPDCTVCHGPKEGIAPEVLARLTELYPNDEATGYSEGDLRGWFWVEVPAGH